MSTETFSASDRVKFSYHPDGFVQFSGENRASIISGRDPVTGEPKGMGFMTNPLVSPVITGPSFGISFWGLDDFQEQKGTPRGDQVIFDESDVVYDHCDESTWGAYGISFFIFGLMFQPYVRKTGPREFEMDLWLNQFLPDGGAFNLKVVRLGQQPYFLGAVFFRRPWHAGGGAPPSGWIIGSPGARTRGWIKPVMHAHYPGNGIEIERSLDYGQWTPDQPGESDDADGTDSAPEARFARDYRRLFQQAEAELLVRAPREVPVLDVVHEGTAVLAEMMDGVQLLPIAQTGPAGAVRAATAILVVIVMRAARSFALLVGAGYAAEAASLAGRMQSAVSAARQIRDDESGEVALRLVGGATVKDIDPELWEQSRHAMEVHLGQLPGLSPIVGPAGSMQPGIGFAGQRDPRRDNHLGNIVLLAIGELSSIAFPILRGDGAANEIRERVDGYQSYVANVVSRHIQAARAVQSDQRQEQDESE